MTDHIRPHIGRTHGSKNSAMQDRAIRTREAVIAVAAQQFDIEGYGNATINTILAAGKFARGALYYHFPSKEAIAQQLVADWNLAIDESTHDASEHAAGGAAFDRLTAIFSSLAHKIADDTNLRAGMKLTLEPTIGNGSAFARWVDTVSAIVDTAITEGEIPDTPTAHRLAWNLCAGTIGATHACAFLREDIDLTTRIGDTVAAHIKAVSG